MTLQTSSMLKTHGHTVLLMANVVECSATHSELILLTSICCTMTHQTSCLLNTYQNKCMRSNILRAHRKVTWRISFYGKTTTQTWHMSNTHTGHVFFWHQSFSAKLSSDAWSHMPKTHYVRNPLTACWTSILNRFSRHHFWKHGVEWHASHDIPKIYSKITPQTSHLLKTLRQIASWPSHLSSTSCETTLQTSSASKSCRRTALQTSGMQQEHCKMTVQKSICWHRI